MNSGAIKLDTPVDAASAHLELLSGTEVGRKLELKGSRIAIGRAEDNEIVAMAEGVSRRHAFMAMSDGDWFIRDNDSKNGVVINGEKLRESWLSDGDVVALGDFIFRFHHKKVGGESPYGNPANLPAAGSMGGNLAMGADANLAMDQMPSSANLAGKKPVNRRAMLYGGVVLVLGLLFMMTSGEDKPAENADGTTSATDRLARDFDVTKPPLENFAAGKKPPVGLEDPLLKKAEQDMSSLDWSDTSLQQAELFFRRGQRDYLNKNYHRSIEAFQTSLSLYKGHSLAERYLRHAISEAEVEAKKNMAVAVQYFESLQYQRAIYHFRAAQQLMAHRPEEPMIKEATRYIQQAELRLRAAELFP